MEVWTSPEIDVASGEATTSRVVVSVKANESNATAGSRWAAHVDDFDYIGTY